MIDVIRIIMRLHRYGQAARLTTNSRRELFHNPLDGMARWQSGGGYTQAVRLGTQSMAKVSWKSEWLAQIGVAVGYALLYIAIHPLSSAHWPINAGLRFVCVLLLPYRFWPALLLGEALPNAYNAYICLDAQGWPWVIARCVPPSLLVMPVVWWCRTRMPPFPSKYLVDVKALIVCVLLASLAGAAYSSAVYALSVDDQSHPLSSNPLYVAAYFMGPYLAILSIMPWALMAKLDYRAGHVAAQVRRILSSKLLLDVAALLIPTIAVLTWLSFSGGEVVSQIAPVAMFIPLAWLTLKYGWRAVAVGGPLVIVCVSLSIPDDPDARTFATQAFLMFAVTCLFALGARISSQLMQEESERESVLNVQRLARQSLQLGEQRMRQTAQALEYLAGTLHVTNGRLLEQMRRIVPNIESHAFYKQAMATQNQVYQLAESMHPVAWRERGLPAALNETVARALDEAGIAYRCEITGRGFTRLAPAVLTATYRAVCEAVVYVSSRLACTRVKLVLRGGETNGKRWVVLRVEGSLDENGVANAVYLSEERQRLATKLGASALDVAEMRDHVRIFDGVLHTRMPRNKLQVTALLLDAAREVQSSKPVSTPMRLWVK
jgi:two-component system, NarL family, sensor histidine kinase FusK